MFNWYYWLVKKYYNLSIFGKLFYIFMNLVVLTMVVSVIALISQRKAQATVDQLLNEGGQIATLSLQSNEAILQARRNEKDYLLRYEDEGFEEAYDGYVTGVIDQVDVIQNNMNHIRALTENSEIVDATNAIDQATDTYESAFLSTIALIETRGDADTGLGGALNDKAQALEEAVGEQNLDPLTILMLEIRRQEKDYLLHGQQQSVDDIHSLITDFKDTVAVVDIPAADIQNLIILINEYQDAFDEVVQSDTAIATSIANYGDAVNHLEPILTGIYNTAVTDQINAQMNMQTEARTSLMIMVGISVLVVIVSIWISYMVAKDMSRAVNVIAAAAEGIAKGDLDQTVEVESKKDEVSMMAQSFQRMIAYMQEMANVATNLAHGDVTATLVPQSEKDVLGNAFAQMTSYLQETASIATDLSKGNLILEITPRSENDVLGNAFSQMLVNLRRLISQVQLSAEQVAEASEQLSMVSDQAGQASQQVADTIQQIVAGTNQQTISTSEATGNLEQVTRAAEGIARGAQEQAEGVQRTSELIDVMATLVSQTKDTTQIVSTANGKMTAAAQRGVTVIEQTNQGMETIRQRAATTAEKIKEMSNRSKEIGRIVETIDDIADKTDMLALNAAVEAARAGEHGRGFAVVAEQVRKLSEDSKNATRDIDKLIERVEEGIGEATAAMASTVEEVNKGAQLTADTDQALREIMRAAEEAVLQFNQISEAMSQMTNHNHGVVSAIESVSTVVEENLAVAEELSANSQEVAEAMESVVSVAEENSAATEEASASTEELSAQVEEVVAAAKELSDLADALRDSTRQFQLQAGERTIAAGARDNGHPYANGRRDHGLARVVSANGGE